MITSSQSISFAAGPCAATEGKLMTPADDLNNPIFLRELSKRLSWGKDPERDRKIFADFSKVMGVPPKAIMDAVIDWQMRQILPFHHEGNNTFH